MSATAFVWLGVVAGVMASAACFRQSAWYANESRFWSGVADEVRRCPGLGEFYLPIMHWAQAHRPGFWQRLGPWRSPPRRWKETA